MSSLRWRLFALCLVCVACRPATPAGSPLRARAEARARALAPAGMLPPTTVAFVVAPSFRRLADRADFAAWAGVLREGYEQLSYKMFRSTGLTLDPEVMAAAGIDVDGPVGVAVLWHRGGMSPVAFASLASPGRFKAAYYRRVARRPRVKGGMVVLRDEDVTWLVRGDWVFASPDEDLVEDLIELGPNGPTLATQSTFREALDAPGRPMLTRPLAGFVDLRALVYDEQGLDPRWGGADLAAARRRIEQAEQVALRSARDRGAGLRELARIDRYFSSAREALRDDEDATAARAFWGDVGGLGFGLRLRRNGVAVEAHLAAPADSAVARLFAGERARPAPLQSLSTAPYLGLELRLEPEIFAEHGARLLPRLMTPDALGKAIDGTATMVVTELAGRPAFAARVGIGDEAAMRGVLGRVAELGGDDVRRDGDDLIVALVPGFSPVRLGLRGDVLVASTHRALLERLTALPRARSYGSDSRALRLLRGGEGAVVFGGKLAAFLGEITPPALPARKPAEPPSAPELAVGGDERAQLQAELRRIDDEIARVRDRARRRRIEATRRRVEALGDLAVALRATKAGLELQARWDAGTESLPAAVASWVDPETDDGDAEALIAQLDDRRFEVLGKLQELQSPGGPPQVPSPQVPSPQEGTSRPGPPPQGEPQQGE